MIKKLKLNRNTYLTNRVIVSPMCQYSAINGSPTEWHYKHLSNLISSGASMLIIESTAVSKIGRITLNDLGLYNNKQLNEFKKLIKFLKKIKNIPICLQISHSGRKGSCNVPWLKSGKPLKNNKWKTISSSNKNKDLDWPKPKMVSLKETKKIITEFVNCAKKAFRAGFDGVEIHMAHGYLIHQFLSPICNNRQDNYGGSLKKRCNFALEIAKKIKSITPNNKFIGARVTGSDHLKNGINIKDSIYLINKLKELNLKYICISSGGIISRTNLKNKKKAFRINLSKKIKNKVKNILIGTTGKLDNIKNIDKYISSKKIDLAFVGRPFLKNSQWLYDNLNKNEIPKQYLRAFVD
jgi:2,4-dienoyl-CoA reductase-like NADH-dependent reductase (Old Yellow Enzyme family)